MVHYHGTFSWYILVKIYHEHSSHAPPNRTPSSCSRRPLSKTPRTWERGTRNGNLFQCAIENIESLPFWKGTVNHTYSHLVVTNIAMENPNHQWRFRSLGTPISLGHGLTMANWLCHNQVGIHWRILDESLVLTNSYGKIHYFFMGKSTTFRLGHFQ